MDVTDCIIVYKITHSILKNAWIKIQCNGKISIVHHNDTIGGMKDEEHSGFDCMYFNKSVRFSILIVWYIGQLCIYNKVGKDK